MDSPLPALEFRFALSMRRGGELIGKLGKQNFTSVFRGLEDYSACAGLDNGKGVRLVGSAPGYQQASFSSSGLWHSPYFLPLQHQQSWDGVISFRWFAAPLGAAFPGQ